MALLDNQTQASVLVTGLDHPEGIAWGLDGYAYAGGEAGHDLLRYDVAYTYRLAPVRYEPGNAWELNAIAEMNGRYVTDGSNEVFLSPGIQFVTTRWSIETAIQIPVVQDLAGPETDYKFVVGFRYLW